MTEIIEEYKGRKLSYYTLFLVFALLFRIVQADIEVNLCDADYHKKAVINTFIRFTACFLIKFKRSKLIKNIF